jgi:predicted Holliday junction resolvase-like endonuclease
MDPTLTLVVAGIAGALFGSVVTALLAFGRRRRIEKRVLQRSRAVLKGQLGEQLAPLVDGFPYASKDARFLGNPIDYVVFRGLSDGDEVEIVLVEVKTGAGRLSENEARVERAVKKGRVRFEIVRLSV